MMTLAHSTGFSASHVLPRLPSWHRCARMHGHTWTVTVESVADVFSDEDGAQIRVAAAEFEAWVKDTLDHRHLNEVDAELQEAASPHDLARWIHQRWAGRIPHLAAVRVAATSKDKAVYPN